MHEYIHFSVWPHMKLPGLGERKREDDDVREIPAVGAPLNPTRSLHWVLDKVSEVWETGRNQVVRLSRNLLYCASLPESAL